MKRSSRDTLPGFRNAIAGSAAIALIGVACHSARAPEPPSPARAGEGGSMAPETFATATVSPQPAPAAGVTAQGQTTVSGGQAASFEGADFSPRPPVRALSASEQQRTFLLPAGYRMEPVLTEPDIKQPASIAFDGNGRMYVLELRTYMLDADSRDQLEPWSRISRWEDSNGDGVYDRGTVFVDSLVFPRFVTPLGDGVILTKNSNEDEVWMYTDSNGDGRADRRELFTGGFGRSANVEHQEAYLRWSMDNWMYSTYNNVRIRWTPNGVIREPIGNISGQWGITQDDDGKIYSQGGASGLPAYFQFPVHYGTFNHPAQIDEGLREVHGVPIHLADMQGGMPATRMPDGSLARVTAGAGAGVFRGHRLPQELRGHYFYGEVVGRIVRRVVPVKNEGLTQLRNFYEAERSEFIRATDPLFRPLGMETAPDGTMYIVDMYHGIIQEGQWTQRGSYLRARIEQHQLDRIIDLGRIWRLSHEGMERDRTQPRMYQESSAQLVRHLEHPNGWWRDMAQQQLVLRQDRSVAPALRVMARTSDNLLARFHALWALEGIGELDAALVRELMKDQNPRMRIQALRAGETLYKAGDRTLAADYQALTRDADPEVVTYALLAINVLRVPNATEVVRATQAANPAAGVQFVAAQILTPPTAGGGGGGRTAEQLVLFARGDEIFRSMCTECHGDTGAGTSMGQGQLLAPSLIGSDRVKAHPEYVIKTLLHGLTGAIEGRSYGGGLMLPMGAPQTDEWVAAVTSYVRNGFTNNASFVTVEEVARVRQANRARTRPWTYEELIATIPVALEPQPNWQVTASHSAPTRIGNTGSPSGAFILEGWTTGVAQQPGMWFQIGLPDVVNLAEVAFESPNVGGGGPNAAPPRSSAPSAFAIEVSLDGSGWTRVAEGSGTPLVNRISFDPVRARYVRILQNAGGPDAPPWSMQRLRLFERRTGS